MGDKYIKVTRIIISFKIYQIFTLFYRGITIYCMPSICLELGEFHINCIIFNKLNSKVSPRFPASDVHLLHNPVSKYDRFYSHNEVMFYSIVGFKVGRLSKWAWPKHKNQLEQRLFSGLWQKRRSERWKNANIPLGNFPWGPHGKESQAPASG